MDIRMDMTLRELAEGLYEESGSGVIYDLGNLLELEYKRCKACDNHTPDVDGECLICGQSH